jgi:HK97 family phage major capsid protein
MTNLDPLTRATMQRAHDALSVGLSKTETKRYSLTKLIRALAYGATANGASFRKEAGLELEASAAAARRLGREVTGSAFVPAEVLTRAMGTGSGPAGGFAVGVENLGFLDMLRNRSVVRRMGARVVGPLEGNVTVARQTGKTALTWQSGDGASVTATDQVLEQIAMTPKTAIAITDVSHQLLRQTGDAAEALVTADLANACAEGLDVAALVGAGGAEPVGIKGTPGVTTGQDAGTLSFAKALGFASTAGAANAIRGNPGFVTNIAGATIAMQRVAFAGTASPLWTGNQLDGQFVGFRAMSSEAVPSAHLIFGSWDELVVGEWGVLELATDTGGTRFNSAQVGIRAMWMVDVMLRYPQAFVVSTNLS